MSRKLPFLVAISLFGCFSQQLATMPDSILDYLFRSDRNRSCGVDSMRAEEYEIYSVFLNSFRSRLDVTIVVMDRTISSGLGDIINEVADSNAKSILRFDSLNTRTYLLCVDSIRTAQGVLFLSSDELESAEKNWGWSTYEAIYKRYPGAYIIKLSRAAIDESTGIAVVFATTSCGLLCGSGDMYVLSKQSGTWRVAKRRNLWIS